MKNLLCFTHKRNWISEEAAAERLYRTPVALRKLALSGHLPVTYRSTRTKGYLYCERDIIRYLERHTVYHSHPASYDRHFPGQE